VLFDLHMDHRNSRNCWRSEIGSRLGAQWQLKLWGLPVFIGIFFTAYFLLLRYPVFEVTLMPVTAFDEAIPFQPASLGVYFSLWFYVSFAAALIKTRAQLITHGKVAAGMGLTGFAVFFFWPTAIPHAAGLRETGDVALTWLKQVDAAGNACPSLHVAFAVFSGVWLNRALIEMRTPLVIRLFNYTWCAAIAYSTLSTKQHVLVDVIGGGILGAIAGTFGVVKEKPGRGLVVAQRETAALRDR
jgi:membrane-associated phospholipid phosphatase